MKLLFTCIMLWEFATVIYGKTFYAVDNTAYDDDRLPTEDAGSKIIVEEDSNKKFYETPVRRPPIRDNDDKEVRGDSGRRTTFIDNGGKINDDDRFRDRDRDRRTDERIFKEDSNNKFYERPVRVDPIRGNDDEKVRGYSGRRTIYIDNGRKINDDRRSRDYDRDRRTGEKISYNDLKYLNVDCYPRNTCVREKIPGIKDNYSCSSDRQCSKFGTCCIDSPDRNESQSLYKCVANEVPAGADGYYMVNKCPPNTDENSIWKSPCEDEWRGEDNILRIAPVTSLNTNTTYKNYYCLRCHESTDSFFLYWELLLQIDDINEELREPSDFVISYNQEKRHWDARSLRRGTSMEVKLKFVKPKGGDVIAIKCIRKHCAICNYSERYRDFPCVPRFKPQDESTKNSLIHWSKFNFARMIDVNYLYKGKKANRQRCDGNYLWDPFGKKCIKLVCALPDHVVVDGKCSPQ